MAKISVNGRMYNGIQLIAFDKDGTLIDFHHLWGDKGRRWIQWLVDRASQTGSSRQLLQQALCHTLGYQPDAKRVIADSPLAVASLPTLATIAAAVLYQQGSSWPEAEQIVQASMPATICTPPTTAQVVALGDVSGTMTRLAQAGIRLVVITSDNRAATEATLPHLKIVDQVEFLICGDDDIPNKPAPDALWQLRDYFNIDPAHMLMVGDTVSDMMFGHNAGVAGCIGKRNGAGDQTMLSQYADTLIDTIEDIRVVT